MAGDKIVPIPGRSVPSQARGSTRLTDMLVRMQSRSAEHLTRLLERFLNTSDDSLFALADKSEETAARDLYFNAMREVRIKRQGMRNIFLQEWDRTYRRFLTNPYALAGERSPEGAFNVDSMKLMDNDELEEDLAIKTMEGKAEQHYVLPLTHLGVRLGWLAGDTKLAEVPTPFSPAIVCNAFRACARGLELDIRSRLVVYKLFEHSLMEGLGELYQELNHLLVDAGVLPELKTTYRARSRPGDEAGGARTGAAAEAPGREPAGRGAPAAGQRPGADPGVGLSGGEVFDLLRRVESRIGSLPGGPGGGGLAVSEQPRFGTGEVMQALSGIQQRVKGGETYSLSDVRALLNSQLQSLAPGGQTSIGRSESEAIDVIGMLFDFILDDPNLTPVVKVLLSRLQIPMIKVAVVDRSFFSKRLHPARRLLNALAQAGMGLGEEGAPGHDQLLGKIEEVVNRVLLEFVDDVAIFAGLLEDFESFQRQERRRSEIIEQRTRQAEQGRARATSARRRVDEEIGARLRGKRVPEVIRELLQDAWSRVLFITYLQEGPESDAWRHGLETADLLLWTLEPKNGYEQRKELIATIPKLLQALRVGLTSISYDPVAMRRLFKGLEECHIGALRVSRGEPAAPSAEDRSQAFGVVTPGGIEVQEWEEQFFEPASTQPPEVSSPEPQAPAAPAFDEQGEATVEAIVVEEPGADQRSAIFAPEPAEYRERVAKLAVGGWVEFRGPGAGVLRAKLSARIRDDGGERLLFVNRSGVKVAEKDIEELARALRQGQLVLLDDRLLFDRALEAVITSLQDLNRS